MASTIKFEGSYSGYNALMDSSSVQSLVQGKMAQVASSCNSTYSHGTGYSSGSFKGKRVTGAYCHTDNIVSMRSEKKHNRLVKALAGVSV